MFPTVSIADKFNSLVSERKLNQALSFMEENDVKFSYIDSKSISCFEAISSITLTQFNSFINGIRKEDLDMIAKISILLLEKEPHYWFKKLSSEKSKDDIYYFFKLFLKQNNLEKIQFFNQNVKQFIILDLEKNYIFYDKISKEMEELIRDSAETTKITIEEISLAYSRFDIENTYSTDKFVHFLDELIKNKNTRKLTYKNDELTEFVLLLTKNKDFMTIFPKIIELYTPELFKKHKKIESAKSINEQFPFLSTRLDFLAARLFSCMNFSRSVNGLKEEPVDKNFTLPLLTYLQKINPKQNINDYLIGEFRYKFIPFSLELIPNPDKDWPDTLGLSKNEGYSVATQYFSNFYVHLLSDSLVLNSTFSNEEKKIELLTQYKTLFPEEFKKDLESFEIGLQQLGIEHTFNAKVNNIKLYFQMLIEKENQLPSTVKSKLKKI